MDEGVPKLWMIQRALRVDASGCYQPLAAATYTGEGGPGHFFAADVPLLPQWADLQPFAMDSSDQFRPAGPPDLGSTAWATAAASWASCIGARTAAQKTRGR